MIKRYYKLIFVLLTCIFLQIELSAQFANKTFEDGVIFLSKTIASDNFKELDCSDLEKVDSLFIIAVNYYDNDISEALLALTFATLPFNKMSTKLPLINVRIPLHLPSVEEKLFYKKRDNLPGNVLFNSAIFGGNDKDKVAHFFGNAFLAYNVTVINISKFLGFIVEMFESAFEVSNGVDNRDLQVNYLGEFFGSSLQKNQKLVPSDFFKLHSLFFFSYN